MAHVMSFFATTGFADSMWLRRDRVPRAGEDDGAGLAPMLLADPDPQVQASLDILLGKLDGLVDSIYERAASRS